MTPREYDQFKELRKLVFEGIRLALEEDGGCKSYEGYMEIRICYPNYFEQEKPIYYNIHLSCYVLGPSRGYDWGGATLHEAIEKARVDITSWVEPYLEQREKV